MKHLWSVLCSNSIIDTNTNTISLINCLEEIKISTNNQNIATNSKENKPLFLPINFEVVSLLQKIKKETTSGEIKIDIYDPSNKKTGTSVSCFSFPNKRIRIITKILGFSFSENGEYVFKIYIKNEKIDKKVAEIPLDIQMEENNNEVS